MNRRIMLALTTLTLVIASANQSLASERFSAAVTQICALELTPVQLQQRANQMLPFPERTALYQGLREIYETRVVTTDEFDLFMSALDRLSQLDPRTAHPGYENIRDS